MQEIVELLAISLAPSGRLRAQHPADERAIHTALGIEVSETCTNGDVSD